MFSQKSVYTGNILFISILSILVLLITCRINAVNKETARYVSQDSVNIRISQPFDTFITHTGIRILYGRLDIFVPEVVQAKAYTHIIMSCKHSNTLKGVTNNYYGRIRLICSIKEYIYDSSFSGKYLISKMYGFLTNFKAKMTTFCIFSFPEPHATLLYGIIFGNTMGFSKQFSEVLIRVGLSHIVSASGYNVSYVMYFVSRVMLLFLPKKVSWLFTCLFLILYACISGLSAPILRATCMSLIVMIVSLFNLRISMPKIIILTICCLSIFDPYIVLSVSFQLSMLSTLSILYVYPFLLHILFRNKKNIGFLGESILITVSVCMTTIPLTIYSFGEVSVIVLLSNVLVLWCIPIIMSLGVLFLCFSIISRSFAGIFVFLLWVFLEYIIAVSRILSRLPFASLEIGETSIFFPIIWNIVLFCIVFGYFRTKKSYRKVRNTQENE